MASVGSAQRPGPVLFAAVFPEFIAREKPGQRGTGRQGRSAGLVRPAAQRGLGPARLDGQAPRATVAGKSDELGERRTAANGPGGALKPTPRGERPCVPAARLAGWLLVDQVQPVRCMRGAPSKARRGWAVQPIPGGQAPRAGQERRDGRRHQGSKPHGRDSARGAGQRPRARRRHAGMLYCSQQNVSDAIVLMSHNVATSIVSATMASNDVVRARIDGQIKEAATVVLAEMGLSISDAIRMLLTRIAADKALPFDINRVSSDSDRKAP